MNHTATLANANAPASWSASAMRCLLFVPGARPERFAKAVASGADAVVIDLEDAVPLADKPAARLAVMAFLSQPRTGSSRIGVRINALTSVEGLRDLLALVDSGVTPDFVMLAKTSDAAEVRQAAAILTNPAIALIALVETTAGIAVVEQIATASSRLMGLMFGGADYAVELRAEFSWEPLLYARQRLVAAAAAAGIAAIDVPFLELQNEPALAVETRRVVALGYTCKSAIHPAQVMPIQSCFTPDPASVARAQRIVAAAAASGDGALQVDGRLVDRPVVLAMQRILALAELTTAQP